MTSDQVTLYTTAQEAYNNGEYLRAVEVLRTSLALGELNMIYLSLGLAQYKLGKCKEALNSFNSAMTAPTLKEPTPAQVAEKIEKYKKELTTGCPGELTITCKPANIQIAIDGGDPQICLSKPIDLSPGKHSINARLKDQVETREVTILPMESSTEAFEMVLATPPPVVETPTNIWPWVTIGAGVTTGIVAVYYHNVVLTEKIDNYNEANVAQAPNRQDLFNDSENAQSTALVLYSAAITTTLGGVIWLILDDNDSKAQAAQTGSEAKNLKFDGDAWITPDSAGVQIQMDW